MAFQRLGMACRSIRRVNRCATMALLLSLFALSLLAAALLRRLARRISEVGIPPSMRMSLGAPRHARRNGHLPLHADGPPHAIANQGNKIGPEVRVLQSQRWVNSNREGLLRWPRTTAPYRELSACDDHPDPEVQPDYHCNRSNETPSPAPECAHTTAGQPPDPRVCQVRRP